MDRIVIHGARQHNLKNVNLTLPRNKFIVITGVSGSGKSSLAFDTLFAEGQRRYMEALSTHARQYLQQLDAPQVDGIQGLSPAIAIEQKSAPRTPRSTVGTLTEIHNYLRILFSRLGNVYCPRCGTQVRAYSLHQMIQEMREDWPEGSRLLILAPMGTIKEKEVSRIIKRLRRDGFARIRLDGTVYELDPLPVFPRRASYDVEILVDRLILREGQRQRLADSLELASKLGKGTVIVSALERGDKLFSEIFRCTSCGLEVPEPSISLFSFHHPAGACPGCNGLGYLGPALQDQEQTSPASSAYDVQPVCPQCHGTRLNAAARSVKLGDLGIHEVSRMPIPSVREWLLTLQLSASPEKIAERPKAEILQRIDMMVELGLSYLTLERPANTLSGGEAQRIRLAQQISSRLSGVLYVLDEPSIGLHPRDHQRLLNILTRLRDEGNTVVVVEHDRESILQAEHVVDMGPGAGILGGEVIFSGPPSEIVNHPTSLTGMYLSGRKQLPLPQRRNYRESKLLSVIDATGHNLKTISAHFPLGCMTCVTGVSGSGKSTLVLDTLYRALAARLYGATCTPAPFGRLEGDDRLLNVVLVDQSPLGRTPRSNPATYTEVFDLIRRIFSQIPEARSRGYSPNRFSFNAKGGRCEACRGEGLQRIEMFFLPDVYVTCPVCQGKRYSHDTLEIHFKGHSIADVLDMTVIEALSVFENIPAIRRKLQTLQEVGLGYIRLGQSATTLSGGESQRVKLAKELSRKAPGATLYILDEPTTGLHFEDIEKLLHVLQKLVDVGHTVVIIEHHPDIIKAADYVIDLGPEGGAEGGYIVASGSPEEIASVEGSFTGKVLKPYLKS